MLRVVYDKLVNLMRKHKELADKIEAEARKKEKRTADRYDPEYFYLTDLLTFNDALLHLGKYGNYTQEVLDLAHTVRVLRNKAAHGELPLLDDWWDPDEPRSKEDIMLLLSGNIKIPEGYRFKTSRGKAWITFDPRDYSCSSLKGLSYEDKFAVIQHLLALDVIAKMNGIQYH